MSDAARHSGYLFMRSQALVINGGAVALVLALLIATPLRSHIIIAALMLYAIGYLIAHRRSVRICRLDWVVMGLLSLYVLSRLPVFVLDGYASRYLSPGLHMLAVAPIYLMLRHLLRPGDPAVLRPWMERGVVVGLLGACGVALYQTQVLGQSHASGFLFHINLGYLSCSMTFLALGLLKGGRYRCWLWLAALAGGVTCLLTLSRGAILAIPPLLLLILLLNAKRLGVLKIAGAMLLLGMLALLSYVSLGTVQQRVDFTVSELTYIARGDVDKAVSSGGRLQLWVAASHAFMARPSVGLTYTEREALNETLVEEGLITEWVLGISRAHAHSQYFEIAATGGLLGLLALLGYLVVPGVFHLRCHLYDSSNAWAQTAVVFTAGFALYSLTEAAIHHEMMTAYYAYMQVLLLSLALCHQQGTKPA